MTEIEKSFEQFYLNLKLTEAQIEDARVKYTGVCKKLHRHFYTNEYNGETKLLIGSYGKRTNIRPPRDVDVLFKMPPEKFTQYDNYKGNGQSQLLSDLRNVLIDKYTTTSKISAWGKVVLIEFSDGTHNIELLPAFEMSDERFKIPNSENGGSWEIVDPRNEIDTINDSDKKNNGLTRKLVRMMKKWESNTTINLSSYYIEQIALDFLSNYLINQNDYLPLMIVEFFGYLKLKISSEKASFVETALNRGKKAIGYEKEGNIRDAMAEWSKIFGNDFPTSFNIKLYKSDIDSKIDSLREQFPTNKEEYLYDKYGFTTSINPDYYYKLDALVIQNGIRPSKLLSILSENKRLKKKKELHFEIESNINRPYDTYWKVRNFGDEAEKDFRGEIAKDKGFNKKVENTKYYGEHLVECFCVKDKICVAYDRILVPIGKYE